MAAVSPFRALRPTPAAAARVAAVPYDVVTRDEARALAAGNPLSFLHVSRAEIDLPDDTHPYDESVYRKARENYEALAREAPLIPEDEPCLYFYRLRMGSHVQTGVVGCYALDEYDRDLIKKHERTRPDKEDDRTHHIVALGAQTGPVFLTYRASEAIAALEREVTAAAPLFDFEAADGVGHTVWPVKGAACARLVEAFRAVPALYIADGHHRAASAARARALLRSPETTTMLAVAFPDDQVQILPYHRVVRDLAGQSPAALLRRIRERFEVRESGSPVPTRKGEVGMYLEHRWYTIGWDAGGSRGAASSLSGLDASVLQDQLLGPMLGVGDPRTDKRIDFVGGIRGAAWLERMVERGEAAVAFSLYPVSVGDLMAIADAGEIMPPKSTWFEPKLRDGLFVHTLES